MRQIPIGGGKRYEYIDGKTALKSDYGSSGSCRFA